MEPKQVKLSKATIRQDLDFSKAKSGGSTTNLISVLKEIEKQQNNNPEIIFIISDFVHEEINCNDKAEIDHCYENNKNLFTAFSNQWKLNYRNKYLFMVKFPFVFDEITTALHTPVDKEIDEAFKKTNTSSIISHSDFNSAKFFTEFENHLSKNVEVLSAYLSKTPTEQLALTLKGHNLNNKQVRSIYIESNLNSHEYKISKGRAYFHSPDKGDGQALLLIHESPIFNLGEEISIKISYRTQDPSRPSKKHMIHDVGVQIEEAVAYSLPKGLGRSFGFVIHFSNGNSISSVIDRINLKDRSSSFEFRFKDIDNINYGVLYDIVDDPDLRERNLNTVYYEILDQDGNTTRVGYFYTNQVYNLFIDNITLILIMIFLISIPLMVRKYIKARKITTMDTIPFNLSIGIINILPILPCYIFSTIHFILIFRGAWLNQENRWLKHLIIFLAIATLLGGAFFHHISLKVHRKFNETKWGDPPQVPISPVCYLIKANTKAAWFYLLFVITLLMLLFLFFIRTI